MRYSAFFFPESSGSFFSTTTRPRYFPQLAHARCGTTAAPHSGQIAVFVVVISSSRRARSRRCFVCLCFGNAISVATTRIKRG